MMNSRRTSLIMSFQSVELMLIFPEDFLMLHYLIIQHILMTLRDRLMLSSLSIRRRLISLKDQLKLISLKERLNLNWSKLCFIRLSSLKNFFAFKFSSCSILTLILKRSYSSKPIQVLQFSSSSKPNQELKLSPSFRVVRRWSFILGEVTRRLHTHEELERAAIHLGFSDDFLVFQDPRCIKVGEIPWFILVHVVQLLL